MFSRGCRIAGFTHKISGLTHVANIDCGDGKETIEQLFCGKAPGPDAIPAEVYASGGPSMLMTLTKLFQSMWNAEQIPQKLKDANLVHIYKRKGNRQVCDNHCRISSLLERFFLVYYLTVYFYTCSKVFYLRASVASEQEKELLTWFL